MTAGQNSTPPGTIRGHGLAGHGGEHWMRERLTSAASLLLGLWFLLSLMLLPSLDRMTIVEWLRMPSAAVPMILLIITFFVHSVDGLKTVVDDYVHDEGSRLLAHAILTFAGIGAGALALFSLAKIAFGAN